MKITIAQINTTPNAFDQNYYKIITSIDKAIQDNSDIIVFPELTIPGYLIQDFIYTSGFVDKNLYFLNNVANHSKDSNLFILVGYIDHNHTGIGKPFRNMVAIIKNGKIIGNYQKRLLPEYDVFWEQRYFESGKDNFIFTVDNMKCAILVCEDLWRDTTTLYDKNPLQELKDANVQVLFSLNSSPFVSGKPKVRRQLIEECCMKYVPNIVYVNQIGGNDELVFDGHSQYSFTQLNEVVTPIYLNNEIDIKNEHYNKNIRTFELYDYLKRDKIPNHNTRINEETLQMILLGMKDYITKSGFRSVVLGSSGGIDSALVATLATLALGGEKVHCIMMPSKYSSEHSVSDAKQLHKNLQCNEYLIPINHDPMLETFHNNVTNKNNWNKVADENIQARLRMVNIMMFSNGLGARMLATMNKTEGSVGYGTIYADGAGGYNPIGDLYKTEVIALCNVINSIYKKELIPVSIINKKPSAELAPGQFDEDALLPYPILDKICYMYIENHINDYNEFLSKTSGAFNRLVTVENYNRIIKLINNAEYKRRFSAPIVKLSQVSFGIGRKMPICKGW